MADSPYGITLFMTKNSPALSAQQLANLNGIAPGAWLRCQLSWSQIEQTQGTYTWGQLDAIVAACQAAGINLLYPIQNAPNFYNSVNPATGVDNWPTINNNWLPNVAHSTAFTQALLARYYPGGPNGWFNALEIFNEEFDTANPRDIQSLWLAPHVATLFPLIRAVYPSAPIVIHALRKTPTNAISHYTNWLTNLYTALTALGFNPTGPWKQDTHYYRSIGSGPGPDPKTSDSNTPDIGTAITTMYSVINGLGYFPKIWVGETGWDVWHDSGDTYFSDRTPVTMQQQRQYSMDMLNIALAAGAEKVLFYTDAADTNTVISTTLPNSSSDPTPIPCLVATTSKGLSGVVSGSFAQNPVYSDPIHTGLKEFAARTPSLPIKHGGSFQFHA